MEELTKVFKADETEMSYKLNKGQARTFMPRSNIYNETFWRWLSKSFLKLLLRHFSNVQNLYFILVYLVTFFGAKSHSIYGL